MSWVEIEFDCLPLRVVGRMDPPLDASPAWKAFWARVTTALRKHGSHNAYYLHQAKCRYHLTNSDIVGLLEFQFEGTVLTNAEDQKTLSADLDVTLESEACDWITEPVVAWFRQTVARAVQIEFDRFIQAGDLEKAQQRLEDVQRMVDEKGGYMGMYL